MIGVQLANETTLILLVSSRLNRGFLLCGNIYILSILGGGMMKLVHMASSLKNLEAAGENVFRQLHASPMGKRESV